MKMKLTEITRVSWGVLMALSFVLLSGSNLRAEVQSDFDPGGTYFGGTEGWFNYGGSLGPNPPTTTTPTGGTTLWMEVQPQQYYGKMTSQSWATPDITVSDWNSHTNLEFDVIVNSSWIPSASTNVEVEFQVGGGSAGEVNQYANPTIDTSLKDTIQHVSIPLASMQPFDPTATYWNLSINLYPGYAYEWDSANPNAVPYDARYYIDNVEWTGVVPEPTSLLLLGSCSLLLIGSRRKRC
ncbi:PEP-CTERM sorting domain-containing protein [Bythopirellula goksoeyrii]|uniref:Uncharacterized protein n=1 Tax=Bythopirellula goksoeyrii TaxID=1400387 RepID=A0A5B9QHZ3_9BACT|nr:PEP-CTERM sorting domain-containing protein [Bythopirellula goksoeyrii]QEG37235.1 hypothetical protein Pr1d_45760 [Bythopirellula goksoeyrii]